jgi:hypothetical protein
MLTIFGAQLVSVAPALDCAAEIGGPGTIAMSSRPWPWADWSARLARAYRGWGLDPLLLTGRGITSPGDGHLVNRRRVRSPGLAIMIRPGPSRAGAASRRPRTPMPLLLRGADHRFEKSDGHPVSPFAATTNPAPPLDRNDGSSLPSASVALQQAVESSTFSPWGKPKPSQGVWRQGAT